MKKIQTPILVISLMCLLLLTACSNQKAKELEESKESLTFSNLLNETSQEEVREAMAAAEIPSENIDLFFQNVNDYNNIVEGKSLVKGGFTTIDSLQAEYDIIGIMDMWNAKNPDFIGYNCRITSYELMKDSIKIGKLDTKNSDWLVFDENAIENNPKELFT